MQALLVPRTLLHRDAERPESGARTRKTEKRGCRGGRPEVAVANSIYRVTHGCERDRDGTRRTAYGGAPDRRTWCGFSVEDTGEPTRTRRAAARARRRPGRIVAAGAGPRPGTGREHAARDRREQVPPTAGRRPRATGLSPGGASPSRRRRVVERAKRRVRVSPVSPVRACVQTCPRQNTRVVACRKSGAETRLDSQRIDEVSRTFPTSRFAS